MWMVVGGPAIVVVACAVTIILTVLNPDPVYTDTHGDDSTEQAAKPHMTPAMDARNHAATGGVPQRPVPAAHP